jgi:hypothetical protein
MIRKIELKPFRSFEKAVIGGTYVSDTGCIYMVSLIEGDNESPDRFVLSNMSSDMPTSTIHLGLEEVSSVLKTINARVVDIEIKEVSLEEIRELNFRNPHIQYGDCDGDI